MKGRKVKQALWLGLGLLLALSFVSGCSEGMVITIEVTPTGQAAAQEVADTDTNPADDTAAGAQSNEADEAEPETSDEAESAIDGGRGGITEATTESDLPQWEPGDCRFDVTIDETVECGDLIVPEDRSAEADPDRTIRLHTAIVRSRGDDPAPDPLIYLSGGPGQETLTYFNQIVPRFDAILDERDLILFDQRGVGYSEPALACPEDTDWTIANLTEPLSRAEVVAGSIETSLACRDRLLAEGVNLAAYTSAENAADIDALRQALGYEQANIYGVSYGTRLALTVLRDFGEDGTLRSAVLDSVFPPQVDFYADLTPDGERVFNLLFESCAADEACAEAYPDLADTFYELVDQLTDEPITVEVTRGSNAEPYEKLLDGDDLIDLVFTMLYDSESLPLVPKLIGQMSRGDYNDPSLQSWLRWLIVSGEYRSLAMWYSVMCSEEAAFTTEETVREAGAELTPALQNYFIDLATMTDLAVCAEWEARQADSLENEPVISEVPSLILAGEFDPITPPAWNQLAAETLSNSVYVEFPDTAHGVFRARPCARDITAAFLSDPTEAPETACLADEAPLAFEIEVVDEPAEAESVETEATTETAADTGDEDTETEAEATITENDDDNAAETEAETATDPVEARPTVTAGNTTVNLRLGPGTNYAQGGQLSAGQSLPIVGRNEDRSWWQVDAPNGLRWIAASVTRATNVDEAIPLVEAPTPPEPVVAAPAEPAAPPPVNTAPVASAPPNALFDYGIQVDPDGDLGLNIRHIQEIDFHWVKLQMPWNEVEPSPGDYQWVNWDPKIDAYHNAGLKVLLSIPKAPVWARPGDDDKSVEGPPSDPQTYANFVAAVTARYSGKVQAIEVWNEQNLYYEAGGQGRVNVDNYMTLLKAAYGAIKSINPNMVVVSGALTPTGAPPPLAVDDVLYLRQMYERGLKDYSDAIGAHPSGFANSPDVLYGGGDYDPKRGYDDHRSFFFRNTMEDYRKIMVEFGDAGKLIWVTEFGWPVWRYWGDERFLFAQDNSLENQAWYTVRAFEMGQAWGWVGPMFLWNLDYALTTPQSEMANFGIITKDAVMPVFQALGTMPR